MDSQWYLNFFGLREQPFAPTADPGYFHATRTHKECLFRLWNSIDERQGIAVVLGNYGTGKTTLLRRLLIGMSADREQYRAAVIGSPIPSWTSFALLDAVVGQFGLKPKRASFGDYMEALNQYLLSTRNRINTLIIDDAQNLNKRGQLELLRLIQNLETQQHKLLNLVLFAQLEWTEVLRAAPNFEQRINLTYTLSPIQLEETRGFIDFRLRQAGSGSGAIFTEDAIRTIHTYADGNPRVIVTLCRNSLLVAAEVKRRQVGGDIVLHTIEKTTVPDPDKRARAFLAASGDGGVRVQPLAGAEVKVANSRASGEPVVVNTANREERAAQMLFRAAGKPKPRAVEFFERTTE